MSCGVGPLPPPDCACACGERDIKTKHQDRSGEITEEMKGLFCFPLLNKGPCISYSRGWVQGIVQLCPLTHPGAFIK